MVLSNAERHRRRRELAVMQERELQGNKLYANMAQIILVVHECLRHQPLSLQAQREVLRLLQEALWNVRTHSGSPQAWVSAS